MGKIIVIANQKGGVGKTTTVHAMIKEIAHTHKKKCLVLDFDPQMTLTNLMDIDPKVMKDYTSSNNVADIFDRKAIGVIEIDKQIDFIPSNKDLINKAESSITGKEKMLKRFIESVREEYDFIILDTTPYLGTLFTAAILCADIIVNPIATGSLDEMGSKDFYDKVDEISDVFEYLPERFFVVPTKYDARNSDDQDSFAAIKEELPTYHKQLKFIGKIPLEVLDPILMRSVFKNAAGARVFVRDYIEQFDTGKKDILLRLKDITAKIIKKVK